MKNIKIAVVCVLLATCWACKSHPKDKVAKANAINKKKTHNKDPKEAAAEFLVKITDGRLMDIREGEEATKKGTTQEIRDYGQLMLRDQKNLLENITALAKQRQVTLPQDIGDAKAAGFKDLDQTEGAEFDKKFVKMMKLDHERDIRDFKEASAIKDSGIQQFVSINLPIIKAHLARINAIEKGMK